VGSGRKKRVRPFGIFINADLERRRLTLATSAGALAAG